MIWILRDLSEKKTPNSKFPGGRVLERVVVKSSNKRALDSGDLGAHLPSKIPSLVPGLPSSLPIAGKPPGLLDVSYQSDISDLNDSQDLNTTLESTAQSSSLLYEQSNIDNVDFGPLFEENTSLDVPLLVPTTVPENLERSAAEGEINEEENNEEDHDIQLEALSDVELGQALEEIYESLHNESPVFISNAIRTRVNMLDLQDVEELPVFGAPRTWTELCQTEIGKWGLVILMSNLAQYHKLGPKIFAQKLNSGILSLLCEKHALLESALNVRYDCFPLDKRGEQCWIRKNPLARACKYAPKKNSQR